MAKKRTPDLIVQLKPDAAQKKTIKAHVDECKSVFDGIMSDRADIHKDDPDAATSWEQSKKEARDYNASKKTDEGKYRLEINSIAANKTQLRAHAEFNRAVKEGMPDTLPAFRPPKASIGLEMGTGRVIEGLLKINKIGNVAFAYTEEGGVQLNEGQYLRRIKLVSPPSSKAPVTAELFLRGSPAPAAADADEAVEGEQEKPATNADPSAADKKAQAKRNSKETKAAAAEDAVKDAHDEMEEDDLDDDIDDALDELDDLDED